MPKHITELLNAYLDGELKDSQIQHVETHLVECQDCRGELEALARLSSLLHEVPTPEFTPSERFAAQVNLRLPHRLTSAPKNKSLEIGWWMIPVGLLGSWIFIGTTFLVNKILSVANGLGLLAGVSDWLSFDSVSQANLSVRLGQFGVLSGNDLHWAVSTEAFTRTSLPLIIIQVSIAFLYLSWMAVWWARRRRQEQLLEG
jgi:predicted anti-sigma-YlaC factor YlaD